MVLDRYMTFVTRRAQHTWFFRLGMLGAILFLAQMGHLSSLASEHELSEMPCHLFPIPNLAPHTLLQSRPRSTCCSNSGWLNACLACYRVVGTTWKHAHRVKSRTYQCFGNYLLEKVQKISTRRLGLLRLAFAPGSLWKSFLNQM